MSCFYYFRGQQKQKCVRTVWNGMISGKYLFGSCSMSLTMTTGIMLIKADICVFLYGGDMAGVDKRHQALSR